MADNNNNTTITDQLNLLRSILRSDDHLQIQPSGDFEQVRLKLDHDIQIGFFIDSLNLLDQALTISNIHDLRINKSSNKCPLSNDQWTKLRNYFDQVVQQSEKSTSLHSIIQLIQDDLLQTKVANPKYKPKEKKTSAVSAAEDAAAMNNKFRGADLIFNRILHDRSIDRSQVVIGYEDRFTGMHEIAFNEFKKVHDHEYGVPMHRIRYYKIDGRLVWDRTNKIDVLTGSEQQNDVSDDITPKLPSVQGLYHFDEALHQWIQDPHISLESDDPKTPSTNDTSLPQQCQFLSWNILFDYYHSSLIHTSQRYPAILHTLKSLLPDVICLQEVTANFLTLLLNEIWVQENHYYIIIMQSVISSAKDKSYGQLMMMKNFRPRSFSICPLDTASDESAATTTKKVTKEIIMARFGVSSRITMDLVNVHLHSDMSHNSNDKRCRALENLFKKMNTHNYMVIGDFNFGDYDMKEQEMLEKYTNDVHDLWKDAFDLEKNPGFTFDPSQNICANITSKSQINRRLDRFFIHALYNLYYSIQHLNMTGIDTIPIDRFNNDDDKRINLSDHYALQAVIQFHTRSISHRSALVILPTTDRWSLIEPYREEFDPSFNRWPPHINLLWPFFDLSDSQDDEESILLPLRLLLCQNPSFTAEVEEIDTFVENNISFMKLNEQSAKHVKQLYEQLKKLFPQCCTNSRNSYNPHMTIAQFENEEKRNQAKSSLTLKDAFDFPVSHLYILSRPHDNDTTPFRITHQLPLGSVLQSLSTKQPNYVDTSLQQLFQTMNLYENEQSYERKQDKFQKLSSCFSEMFNKETLHCFKHAFLPYGSFRLGIDGGDVDTVFVLNELKSNEQGSTTFDETLRELKDNPSALNDHIVDLLLIQIKGRLNEEIAYCRKVQALFPIIYILFNDQTKVEIFVQIRTNKERSQEEIHGVHDIERVLVYTRSPPIFQHLLSFVRAWAQHVGLYGQAYGYLSGYCWAILCAHICHSSLSSIKSLSSIEQFSIEDFFALVHTFFSTFAHFPWSAQSFHLHSNSSRQITHSHKSSVHNRGAMRIICPTPPYNNAGRSTMNSTRDLIVQGFQRVVDLLDHLDTTTSEDKVNALKQIVELENDFPNNNIKSLVQLTLSGADACELDEWTGWMKSRLAYFLNDCEEKCHLTVQTQNRLEYRLQNTEALYSIGFALDEQALNQHRNFNDRLHKFLDQFNLYPNRKETMRISHKMVSVHDWKLERMQPKPQRQRK